MPSGASLKLGHRVQRREVLSTAWVARIPPFPWSPCRTERCALPQLTLSRQTPSPLRERLSRPLFLTRRGETRGTHLLESSNSEKLPDLPPVTPLGSLQPCMDKEIFELDVPFSGNLLFLSLQQHPSTLLRGFCLGSEHGGGSAGSPVLPARPQYVLTMGDGQTPAGTNAASSRGSPTATGQTPNRSALFEGGPLSK